MGGRRAGAALAQCRDSCCSSPDVHAALQHRRRCLVRSEPLQRCSPLWGVGVTAVVLRRVPGAGQDKPYCCSCRPSLLPVCGSTDAVLAAFTLPSFEKCFCCN